MSLISVMEKAKKDDKLKLDQDTIVDPSKPVEVISTGSIIIDKLIERGGIGRGRVTELYGLESSGKTSVALHVAKETQKLGGNVAYLDYESALDMQYAKNGIGVDISEERFALLQPQTLEEGCDLIGFLLDHYKESKIDCIIIDSVKAMTPRAVLEGMLSDEPPMALQARKIGNFLSKITKQIKTTGTAILLLNQMTKNIKSNPYQGGGEYETPGGLAVRFYATTRIQLKKVKTENINKLNDITGQIEEMPDTNIVKVSIIKNKLGTPFRSAEIAIKFGKGVDNIRSIIDIAVNYGVIKKGGAWFSYKEDNGGFKLQGDAAMRAHLIQPENKNLLIEIANKISLGVDPEVEKEAKEQETLDIKAVEIYSKKESKKKVKDDAATV